jgi:hypothetical protein
MNRNQANQFRATLGLMPIAVQPTQAQAERERKLRQERNRRERAAANQAIKATRSRNGR